MPKTSKEKSYQCQQCGTTSRKQDECCGSNMKETDTKKTAKKSADDEC